MKASDAGQSPERLLLAAALYGDYGDQISEDEALGGYNLRETVRGLLALQDTRRATVLRLFSGSTASRTRRAKSASS